MILKYIVIIVTIIYLVWFTYIKIKYPFWNNQPVYHTYDFWRTFYKEPIIIYKYRPIKTKFCDFDNIKTTLYSECSQEMKEKIIYLLKSNYIQNDQILFTLLVKDLDTICIGHNDNVYLSIYNDKIYKQLQKTEEAIASDVFNNFVNNQVLGEKLENNIEIENNPLGCVLSYPIMFYYQNTLDNTYSQTPIYYIDFLCAHREHLPLKKTRELFQTHEYNQRIHNPNIVGSLIKREIELFDGVISLVQYDTYVYYLRSISIIGLPTHFQVLHIYKENIDILSDFILTQTHLDLEHNEKYYEFMSIPNMGNYLSMIKSNYCHVYCLKNGEYVYGMYFFKDAKMQYEDLEGNTLHFYGSFMNTNDKELFYIGFLHSIKQIIKKYPEYKMLIFENIGDNTILHKIWRNKNTPTFINKTAYYTFNWVYPKSPINPEKCLFL